MVVMVWWEEGEAMVLIMMVVCEIPWRPRL